MAKLTPMLKQYHEIKDKNQDSILFFRLGDFYEMFGKDAIKASKILNITLTARNKGTENETTMCGIPYHAAEGYIAKLTKAGEKVAICEQVTAPDGTGIVERDVVRIITPGTTSAQHWSPQRMAAVSASSLIMTSGKGSLPMTGTGQLRYSK